MTEVYWTVGIFVAWILGSYLLGWAIEYLGKRDARG